MRLETYINYLHSFHSFLHGLKKHILHQETVDTYCDLNPLNKQTDKLSLFDEITWEAVQKLDSDFRNFIEYRDSIIRLNYRVLEKSSEWGQVLQAAENTFRALDAYMKSLGIEPGAIFNKVKTENMP